MIVKELLLTENRIYQYSDDNNVWEPGVYWRG